MLHSWRVIPSADRYTALIDGVDHGRLMAGDLETAIAEIKQMIAETIKAGKK